jgi:hypothetical protein
MDQLAMPRDLAGVGVQGDERVRIVVVARALAAEVVRAGGAGGDEDEAAARIDRQH